jgi:hypothetical protein
MAGNGLERRVLKMVVNKREKPVLVDAPPDNNCHPVTLGGMNVVADANVMYFIMFYKVLITMDL